MVEGEANDTSKAPKANDDDLKLFEYQSQGAEWLFGLRKALLADEMGLGKSAQAITAASRLKPSRVVVLCPAVARDNWDREFRRFSDRAWRSNIIYSRTEPRRLDADLIISSYDLADGVAGCLRDSERIGVLILDEAQFLKSTESKRTQVTLGRGGLVRRADRVWALSGTPAPNHAAELWPLLFTFGQTKLSYPEFVERFCNTYRFKPPRGEPRIQITGTKTERIDELRAILAPIMLRRRKVDVLKDLPSISFSDIVVPANPVDYEIQYVQWTHPYDRRAELEAIIDKERKLVTAICDASETWKQTFSGISGVMGSVAGLRRYTGLQKVDGIAELVASELENGDYEKIVIFGIHQGVIEGLRQKLRPFKPVTLYGQTPAAKRQINVDKFQKNPRCKVFIGNIQAAGTAITLTAAHNVLFAEQSWVPGENAQAAMRCHRIGQERPVTVRFAGLANSIDEKVASTLRRKTKELMHLFDGRFVPSDDPTSVEDASAIVPMFLDREDIFS